MPAADFFVDYLTTALDEGELLVEIRVPKHEGWGMHYEKFNRVAQAWSIVAVAACVRREGGTHRRGADRADQHGPDPAAGARASRRRWPAPTPPPEAIAAAAEHAAEGTSPSSDLNAQADYREHLATVLTRRAVTAAAGL